MEKFIVLPIAIVLITGLALQLNDIAQRTSQKTIRFATDVDNAMDCALFGVDIKECSPDLVKNSGEFERELRDFREVMQEHAAFKEANGSVELAVPLDGAFAVSVIDEQYVFKLVKVEEGVAEFEGVNLRDVFAREDVPLMKGGVFPVDVDEDGVPDVRVRLQEVNETGAVVVVSAGDVSLLDLSVVGLLAGVVGVLLLWLAKRSQRFREGGEW
ncbi:hypothetical protein D6783_01975 [Candidatus Woesearchaeota archaeon]|nr:MAG: hypothetical protein D6783_01975 [Candidatus Woesearchaeota archaeon]